jgi:tetratricopeptide (TPR) repeat protein
VCGKAQALNNRSAAEDDHFEVFARHHDRAVIGAIEPPDQVHEILLEGCLGRRRERREGMYRFNKSDNAQARHFFETAVQRDPTFARAYSGLSFTHFQNAFQGWADRAAEADRAFEAAGQSLMADDRDPAAHWAMGRALWLRGRLDQSVIELEQAIDLSPNFAQGHYSLAFVHSQAGDPVAAISSADHSRHLSPFDPMLFGMLGARAMALVRLGRFDEAAEWGVRAASRPNAHAQILAIAALSLSLADRLDEARTYLSAIRKSLPRYGIDDFLTAMKFAPEGEQSFRKGARRIGMN